MKKTNEIVDNDHEGDNLDINLGDDSILNQPITDDEIEKAIKKNKKQQSPWLWLYCE